MLDKTYEPQNKEKLIYKNWEENGCFKPKSDTDKNFGGENYSIIMIYDYLRKAWVKRKSQKINALAVINGTLYSAGKKIYQEYTSLTFDGGFIESYYKCTPLNLGYCITFYYPDLLFLA